MRAPYGFSKVNVQMSYVPKQMQYGFGTHVCNTSQNYTCGTRTDFEAP